MLPSFSLLQKKSFYARGRDVIVEIYRFNFRLCHITKPSDDCDDATMIHRRYVKIGYPKVGCRPYFELAGVLQL